MFLPSYPMLFMVLLTEEKQNVSLISEQQWNILLLVYLALYSKTSQIMIEHLDQNFKHCQNTNGFGSL